MSALSKAEIANNLVEQLGFDRKQGKAFAETFFEEICNALENGHHVKLSGFGNFCLRDKPERPGRNPKTGEPIPVLPRRVVTFRSGVKLRERIYFANIKNNKKNNAIPEDDDISEHDDIPEHDDISEHHDIPEHDDIPEEE